MGKGQVVFGVRLLDPARPLLGPMLASRSLLTAIRRTAATVSVLFAGLSVLVGASPDLSAADTASRVVTGVLAAAALVGAVWLLRAREPPFGRGAIAFGVFADVGVASVISVIDEPLFAMFAAVALALPGVFVMIHLARSWLVAHLAFGLTAILVLAARAIVSDRVPLAVVLAGVLLLTAVVIGTPWTMRRSFVHALDRAERAFVDPVTGALNRWGLEAALAGLRPTAPTAPVTVVMIDIDRFKAVNDVHGHGVGDRVLRQVATDLAVFADVRGGIVARTGGEEFATVVPGPLDDLTSIPVVSGGRGGDPTVTLSSGVVTSNVRALTGDRVATVLAEADALMYRAKRAGGGQAVRDDPLDAATP